MKTLILLVVLSTAAFGQSFHVTGIHRATETEKTYKTAFSQSMITGTIGDKLYTLEQLQSWGYYHFQVGADYPVKEVTDKAVKLTVTDKKGRESTERLNVVTVSEVGQ